jgi:F-box/leucine-rich repeat protein 6
MSVNLVNEPEPHASTLVDVCANNEITVKNESENCTATTTTTKIKTTNTANDDDDSALLASFPKAEVKLKKLDESRLLMDNNENSLSVDTLIEILSSNSEPKLPAVKKEEENGSELNVPPSSVPSTLNSPSCSSSSSKTGFSSPNNEPSEALPPSSSSTTTSPSSSGLLFSSSSPKKFPSPHYANGGKPMLADLNKKMKQGAARRRAAKPKAVYQSQISDNSVGIKLCIKKSLDTFKTMPSPSSSSGSNKSPKKRSRKSKTSGSRACETDSDDSYVKKRKKPSGNGSGSSSGKAGAIDEPQEQSGWGKCLPREVLLEVSAGAVLCLCLFLIFCSVFCRFLKWS